VDAPLPPLLARALALGPARVVAFTGGGGKTSAMYRLARERAAGRVLVTTTTRIWAPRADEAPLTLAGSLADALRVVRDPGWTQGLRVLGIEVTAEGKLLGVPPDWIEDLAAEVDLVVVEADGAAGKPLTAPRAYEPVIPAATDLLVPVVGADVIDAPLGPERVHRAPEMAELLGVPTGTPLTADLVARVLLDARGNVKGAPPEARIVPLVNKVDDVTRQRAAGELAEALLARGAERVVLARLASDEPVVTVVERSPQRVG
jgi:probable selenium-dependent hydroxylase accessory protein YqeC